VEKRGATTSGVLEDTL